MKELLEAGVHFGHQVRRWNPKMKEYIFGERNGIYIIDLQKTQKMFREALQYVTNMIAEDRGKTVLFVGTKRQAQEAVREEAERAGQYYVNQRWLDGLKIGKQSAKPSLIHIILTGAFGLFAHGFLGLAFCADEQDRLAAIFSDHIRYGLQRFAKHLLCLLQIDNVDAVALAENVFLHLRVPTAHLVAEVN